MEGEKEGGRVGERGRKEEEKKEEMGRFRPRKCGKLKTERDKSKEETYLECCLLQVFSPLQWSFCHKVSYIVCINMIFIHLYFKKKKT